MNKILKQIILLTLLLTLLLPNVVQAQLQFLDDEENFIAAKRIFEIGARGFKSDHKTDEFLFGFSPNDLLSYWSTGCDAGRYQSEAYLKVSSTRFLINTSKVMNRYYLDMYSAQRDTIPPLKGGRIASQVILGSIGGIVGTVGSILIAVNLSSSEINYDEIGSTMFLIEIIGSTLGSALTVYGIGTIGDQTGSLWATLGGSAAGGLVQFLVFSAAGATLIPVVTYPLQAALATRAFNSTRRWDRDIHSGALMRIKTD
jgi:hypothetical protein